MTVLEEALAALAEIETDVIYGQSADLVELEGMTLSETERRTFARADGCEYLTEHVLTLNVFAESCERAAELADAADEILSALGLIRTQRAEGSDGRSRRVLMKFRVVTGADGRKYH